ncbi:MAG: hypothetical protein HFE72_13715, partial [Emergencia sp.]|nr:hypothetical protein [Emergencia sp.]
RQLTDYNWPGNIRELENIATYYQTLSALPPQITEQNSTTTVRLSNASLNLAILKAISEHTQLTHGIGRASLVQTLKTSGIRLSDGKLREFLGDLSQQGFIEVGKGRHGTKITEKGLARLTQDTKE